MIWLKILIVLLCGALFWIGGKWDHNARRFVMPLLLSISALFFSHWDWWVLTMLSTVGVFCLGYGDKSPFRHIFGNGWGRGVWGLLAGFGLSSGLFFSGYLHLYFFIPYLALSFILENALKNLPQDLGDPLIGAGFGLIILCI